MKKEYRDAALIVGFGDLTGSLRDHAARGVADSVAYLREVLNQTGWKFWRRWGLKLAIAALEELHEWLVKDEAVKG